MPRYDYVCNECNHKFEAFSTIKDRNNMRCVKCGGSTTKLISIGCNLELFKPMWYNDICEEPIFIESKKQLKEECKKHNVIACRLL